MEKQILLTLYTAENNQLLLENQSKLFALIPKSVDNYYKLLLSTPETSKFLTNDLVEQHLQNALSSWMKEILSPKQEQELPALEERQITIGKAHARINIGMSLVSEAMINIKNCFFNGLTQDGLSNTPLIQLVQNLFDYALISINKAYFDDHSTISNHSQNLNRHLSSLDFAFEIEKMRTHLHRWFSSCLIEKTMGSILNTDFALWVRHKLPLSPICANALTQIETFVDMIEEHANSQHFSSGDKKLINDITKNINDLSWSLEEFSKTLMTSAERKDPLTQLYNRRYLDSILIKQTEQAQKLNRRYSIAMIDIDLFKLVNDTYGHNIGDTVLSTLGELINQHIRVSDFAFRFGGEEFLVVFTETSPNRAKQIIQTISESFQLESFSSQDGGKFNVTLSAGIAEFNGQPDYQHTIKLADKALYQSKENGRNLITIWQ